MTIVNCIHEIYRDVLIKQKKTNDMKFIVIYVSLTQLYKIKK